MEGVNAQATYDADHFCSDVLVQNTVTRLNLNALETEMGTLKEHMWAGEVSGR